MREIREIYANADRAAVRETRSQIDVENRLSWRGDRARRERRGERSLHARVT